MCGICGVIQVGGRPRPTVSQSTLESMTDVMTHRGPNDRGTYMADGVALGVRRLSIVDVEGGHQPVLNERRRRRGRSRTASSTTILTCGSFSSVTDTRFRSRCDTEILPHLYERFGESFPAKLRGMFGVAVWDERRRRAVLARDRLGIKPLYYAQADDLLVFASELKSLLASGLIEPELDYDAIDAYLTFGFVPGPSTPLLGVSKLTPGHVPRRWGRRRPDGAVLGVPGAERRDRDSARRSTASRWSRSSTSPSGCG